MAKQIPAWIKILGIDVSHISHKERLISSLGAFLGIGGILLVTPTMCIQVMQHCW
jgi:hypothetical protein